MDFRWSVIVPGFYKLEAQLQGGPVAVFNNRDDRTTVLDPGTLSGMNDYVMSLDAGSCTIRFVNQSTQPVVMSWVLTIAQLDWEKILSGGVGQTSALSLSLFSASSAVSESSSTTSNANLPNVIMSGHSSVSVGAVGPVPASLVVTINTGLISGPISGTQSSVVVGPVVVSGLSATASSGNGGTFNFRAGLVVDWSQWVNGEEPIIEFNVADQKPTQIETSIVQTNVDRSAHSSPEVENTRADQLALQRVEWLVRLNTGLQRWFQPALHGDERHSAPLFSEDRLVQNHRGRKHERIDEEICPKRTRSAVHADLSATACLVLVGATTCRLKRPLLKWWHAKNHLGVQVEKTPRLGHRGPHISSIRARTRMQRRKLNVPR
jgi:hypothetical protein